MKDRNNSSRRQGGRWLALSHIVLKNQQRRAFFRGPTRHHMPTSNRAVAKKHHHLSTTKHPEAGSEGGMRVAQQHAQEMKEVMTVIAGAVGNPVVALLHQILQPHTIETLQDQIETENVHEMTKVDEKLQCPMH